MAGLTTDLDALAAQLASILAGYPEIAAAYVFGSVARGEAREDGDLDLGIVYRDRGGAHGDIAARLASDAGRALGVEHVDVVDLETQGPIFAHRVLIEGRRVYEASRERRIDFESDTLVRAFDFRPTYEIATRGKIAAMRRWLRERYDLRADPVEARPPAGPRSAR